MKVKTMMMMMGRRLCRGVKRKNKIGVGRERKRKKGWKGQRLCNVLIAGQRRLRVTTSLVGGDGERKRDYYMRR